MRPNCPNLASLAQKIYAHSGHSSLVHSLLPWDTLLRTNLIQPNNCLMMYLSIMSSYS